MPGQLEALKPRKRKSRAEVKSSKKASATRRRCTRSPRTCSAAESTSAFSGDSRADSPLSRISCECQQLVGRMRCSASPDLQGREGKENELRLGLDLDSCRVNITMDKQDPEDMDCDETDKSIFPDDDSNQILPVEQFFGNLDAVQDFPQRSSATSARGNRRRHYYAREDSDDEVLDLCTAQRDDRGSSS